MHEQRAERVMFREWGFCAVTAPLQADLRQAGKWTEVGKKAEGSRGPYNCFRGGKVMGSGQAVTALGWVGLRRGIQDRPHCPERVPLLEGIEHSLVLKD